MYAAGDVRVEQREDAAILDPTDAVIKVAATCICGSDLWPYRGAEPLFGSGFALFLPALLTPLAGVSYANESLTPRLLVGGALVTLANVVLQLRGPKST